MKLKFFKWALKKWHFYLVMVGLFILIGLQPNSYISLYHEFGDILGYILGGFLFTLFFYWIAWLFVRKRYD